MYTICIYFYIQDIHMFKLYTYMYIGMYKLYMQIHISIHLSSFCSLAKVDALVTQCLQQLDAIFSALGEVHTAGTQTWAMDEKSYARPSIAEDEAGKRDEMWIECRLC